MDGLEICTRLKTSLETKNIPVIMVSAAPRIGEMAKAVGADNFIEKPFLNVNYFKLSQVIHAPTITQ
jgi:CheY-like chemotaxis protein